MAERLGRYFGRLDNVAVRAHERIELPRPAPSARRPGPFRIATMGAIGPIKGFDALLALSAEIHARNAGAELAVIGYTRNDAAARAAGIRVTGPYRNEEAAEAIAREDPDLILIASTVPETYCYTLSHALASGRALAAFDIGALGTRIRDAQALGAPATLLPLKLAREPGALLDALLALRRAGPGSVSATSTAATSAAEKSGPAPSRASAQKAPALTRREEAASIAGE